MFDISLHFRYLQKATEAFFELGQASLAAGLAWQSRINEELVNSIHTMTAPVESDVIEPVALWQSWLDCWTDSDSSARQQPSNGLVEFWQAWANPASTAFVAGASAWPSFAANPFLTAPPWSFYQGPLMAMMLSYGVPYSVAAPTARASTCAMDAADAACAQWRSMFADDQRRRRPAYLH